MLINEVLPAVEKTKLKIRELLRAKVPAVHCLAASSGITLEAATISESDKSEYTIKCQVPKVGHKSKKCKNREYTELTFSRMTFVSGSVSSIESLKKNTLTKLVDCLSTRFSSFEVKFFRKCIGWIQLIGLTMRKISHLFSL